MKLQAIIPAFIMLTVACGSSSPENFAKATARIGCKKAKKCDEDLWKEAGYDNVRECVDDVASDDDVEQFAESCADFDKKAARKCLSASRKAKRNCDDDIDEPACLEVCGAIEVPAGREQAIPTAELGLRMAEIAEASLVLEAGEIDDLDAADDLEDDAALQQEIDAVMCEED